MSLVRAFRLSLAAALAAALVPAGVVAGAWTVSPSGPITTVSGAVSLALPGDTIRVLPGVYAETGILIEKKVTIAGEGHPEIDGGNRGQIFTVKSDSVRVEGLVVKNVGVSYTEDRAGIKLIGVKGCVIRGNRFLNNFFAIYLENSTGCLIAGNRIEGEATGETSTANGIHLWYCKEVTIENNEVFRHRDGIYLEFVEKSTIRGNVSEENERYGLHFMFSHDDAYEGNTFRHNGAGVAVMYSDRVTMTGNAFRRNRGPASYGLLLKDIRDSDVSENRFEDNTIGIHSEGSIRVKIRGNLFRENGFAIRMMASSYENEVSGNGFIGNTFDLSTNSRQNSNAFDGNYWSRYQGYDLDRDGIGDVPHRPVHLFSLLVERDPAGLVLLRSFFVDLIDAAERIVPIYTPPGLLDKRPLIRPRPFKGDNA
jgi:nitrous oxidase accessory protein